MNGLVKRSDVIKTANKFSFTDENDRRRYLDFLDYCLKETKTAYNVDAVVEEVEKLDLDGISMVEDGKYKLIRKKEAISLIQTNGICKGRYKTCAECYKKDCPLSTEKTITDKWGDEVRKGGVNENNN